LTGPTPHEFLQAPIPAARKGDWMDTYQSMVNGGILAPWVNRIAYGKYIFDGKRSYPACHDKFAKLMVVLTPFFGTFYSVPAAYK
jgi:hypothetical protein